MKRRCAIIISITLIGVLMFSSGTLAADLPIDIGAIAEQGGERQDALTVRHRIDLFSETSQETNTELAERQERERLEAKQRLFAEPHELNVPAPEESLLQAAAHSGLFAEPLQSRSFTPAAEEGAGIPIWAIIPVLAAAAGLGAVIAILTKAKRKGRAASVHNHNN